MSVCKTCRICQTNLEPFMSFGKMPIANGFLSSQQFATEYFFDLSPAVCNKCQMFQLIEQPDPSKMFHGNYPFVSSSSKAMQQHFANTANYLQRKYTNSLDDPFVVEIGSNDGTFLQHFANKNIRHLGIEPSTNVAEIAINKNINTISDFFNTQTATKIVDHHGKADLIFAANVMCHIADFQEVLSSIKLLLKPTGVLVFEDPYLGDVIEKVSYDQIYDEHVFLFSIKSIKYAFQSIGLDVIDAIKLPTHGGSMRYVIGNQKIHPAALNVTRLLKYEQQLGLNNFQTYQNFKNNCEQSKNKLLEKIDNITKNNKSIVGYAATSKSTTVINYCGITKDQIQYISDTTPLKIGKFSPGAHIPIKSHKYFSDNYPDHALLFAWNHATEILAKEQEFLDNGGEWIIFCD